MNRNNRKKNELLGMPFGTATNRLRKALVFRMAQRLGDDTCFKCGEKIVNVDDLSMEHKEPWQQASDPVATFFDLENIAFSHLKCNVGARTYLGEISQHGTAARYSRHGCRCGLCTDAKVASVNRWRKKKGFNGNYYKNTRVA